MACYLVLLLLYTLFTFITLLNTLQTLRKRRKRRFCAMIKSIKLSIKRRRCNWYIAVLSFMNCLLETTLIFLDYISYFNVNFKTLNYKEVNNSFQSVKYLSLQSALVES